MDQIFLLITLFFYNIVSSLSFTHFNMTPSPELSSKMAISITPFLFNSLFSNPRIGAMYCFTPSYLILYIDFRAFLNRASNPPLRLAAGCLFPCHVQWDLTRVLSNSIVAMCDVLYCWAPRLQRRAP